MVLLGVYDFDQPVRLDDRLSIVDVQPSQIPEEFLLPHVTYSVVIFSVSSGKFPAEIFLEIFGTTGSTGKRRFENDNQSELRRRFLRQMGFLSTIWILFFWIFVNGKLYTLE